MMRLEEAMRSNIPTPKRVEMFNCGTRRARAALCIAALLIAAGSGQALAAAQRTFPSADEATQALVAALKAGDTKASLAILGASAKPILTSGDPIADRNGRARFVEWYEQAHSLAASNDGASMVLQIGTDEWPFPIPLVKSDRGWRFDTEAGKEEIINRRIGRNERSAIESCLAYVDAQREYYLRHPEGGGVLEYAQRIASSKGRRDGLFWEAPEGQEPSPLGALFARARAEGYGGKGRSAPYHGYYYRILTAQGANASGGAYSYLAHGKMIGGFALVAFPAQYGVSGVMTFLVNHDGVVFEKDLGLRTATVAEAMKAFNPDATWKRADDGQQAAAH